jgi:hypothetical protein
MTPSTQKTAPIEEKKAGVHQVNININGKGFLYTKSDGQSAATIVVRRGDHVTWRCDHGNFSILFKTHSPFADVGFHGRRGTESMRAVVLGERGSYHYSVTVPLDSGLIVDDPEIIVDDGD